MKVLHVTYDMRIGGTEMVIKSIIEGNCDQAIEMSIFCIERNLGPWGKTLKESGIPITSHQRCEGFDTALIKRLHSHIKTHQIDIVHCHQYTPWVYGTLAALFTKAKIIFTEHGRFYPDSSSWKRRLVNPLLMQATDFVTSISEATREALDTYEFIPKQKITVIYNGIPPAEHSVTNHNALKQSLNIPTDCTLFGTVARFDPIKNQLLMVNAFSEVIQRNSNAHLIMIGDGEEREGLEQEVKRLNLSEHVTFTGYVPEPLNLMSLIDIFLLSSLSEGTSMTLLEAMSLGKPCIVTDAGGNREVIVHNVNGLVVPNNDVVAFASAMHNLMHNKVLLAQFGNEARSIFNSIFIREKMVSQYANLYSRCLVNKHIRAK